MDLRARSILLAPVAALTAACSTFYTPPRTEWNRPTETENVKAYIDAHLNAYTSAMRGISGNQDAAAVLNILAALGGTTALALGAGAKVGILAGTGGAGITQITSYAKPHERLQLLGQAVDATTCVRDEYVKQDGTTKALGLGGMGKVYGASALAGTALSAIATNRYLARQVDDAGDIAVDATRAISTSLQMKMANVSQVPDYAAVVKAIEDARKAADASKPNNLTGEKAELVDDLSEYETRIQTCKAKLP